MLIVQYIRECIIANTYRKSIEYMFGKSFMFQGIHRGTSYIFFADKGCGYNYSDNVDINV